MACVVVPMVEAIIVTIAKKIVQRKERKALGNSSSTETINTPMKEERQTLQTGLSWSRKLSWLNNLLWGGVFLLALEHIWHGEIILWPPFLTAMKNPADIQPMLEEMALFGTSMAIFVTVVWVIMIYIAEHKLKYNCTKIYLDD